MLIGYFLFYKSHKTFYGCRNFYEISNCFPTVGDVQHYSLDSKRDISKIPSVPSILSIFYLNKLQPYSSWTSDGRWKKGIFKIIFVLHFSHYYYSINYYNWQLSLHKDIVLTSIRRHLNVIMLWASDGRWNKRCLIKLDSRPLKRLQTSERDRERDWKRLAWKNYIPFEHKTDSMPFESCRLRWKELDKIMCSI